MFPLICILCAVLGVILTPRFLDLDKGPKKKKISGAVEARDAVLAFIPLVLLGIYVNFAYLFPGMSELFFTPRGRFDDSGAPWWIAWIFALAVAVYAGLAFLVRKVKLWKLAAALGILTGVYIYTLYLSMGKY